MRTILFAFTALLVSYAFAQTTTVVVDGESIVEVITTDALGAPLTNIISTLTDTAGVTTETPATTEADDPGQQGPVGQPGATVTGDSVTPYTYTTVLNGVTTAIVDTFTPTDIATVSTAIPTTGMIWDYSSWLAAYGPSSTSDNASMGIQPINSAWWGVVLSVMGGAFGGLWLVLL